MSELSTADTVAIGATVGGAIGAMLPWLLGALGLAGMAYAWTKGPKTMTPMEKAFRGLLVLLIQHIEKLETENDELRKRPYKETVEELDKSNAELNKQLANEKRANESLHATLTDRDKLIETLREPGVVQKTKRRR